MTTKTEYFRISNSSGLSGQAWDTEYATLEDAEDALQLAMGWDDIVLSDWYSETGERRGYVVDEAVSAYETQEECDADNEGAYAPRITRWTRA